MLTPSGERLRGKGVIAGSMIHAWAPWVWRTTKRALHKSTYLLTYAWPDFREWARNIYPYWPLVIYRHIHVKDLYFGVNPRVRVRVCRQWQNITRCGSRHGCRRGCVNNKTASPAISWCSITQRRMYLDTRKHRLWRVLYLNFVKHRDLDLWPFNPLMGTLNRRITDHYTAIRCLVH